MPGADAWLHRDAASGNAAPGELVQIGCAGCFQLGFSTRLKRQSTESVGHQHDDLGIVFDEQLPGKFVHIHGRPRYRLIILVSERQRKVFIFHF
jgi:hypothetical protein